MHCGDKIKHETKIAAENALAEAVRKYKRTGRGGKSWKNLNVYQCHTCRFWHLGRSRDNTAVKFNPRAGLAEQPKILSTGELRRKLARLAESWERRDDHVRKQRLAAFKAIIEADKQVQTRDDERRRIQQAKFDEIIDSVRLAAEIVRNLQRPENELPQDDL